MFGQSFVFGGIAGGGATTEIDFLMVAGGGATGNGRGGLGQGDQAVVDRDQVTDDDDDNAENDPTGETHGLYLRCNSVSGNLALCVA